MTKVSNGSERRKRKKVQKELLKELDEEDQKLTASLFHTGGSLWKQDSDVDIGTSTNNGDPFQIDRDGDDDVHGSEGEEDQTEVDSEHQESSAPQRGSAATAAAWVDEDDVDVHLMQQNNRVRKLRKTIDETKVSASVYEERLRERFQATTQTSAHTDWARLDDGDEDEDDDNDAEKSKTNTLVSAGPLLASKRRLVPNILDIKRCSDLNLDEPSGAVVQSVHFHPGSDPSKPIALTAGLDKTLRFFQVTEEKSEKVHGIHFPRLPISSAWFLGTTGTVVASGRRSFFYLYDSVAGKLDRIPKLSGRNEQSLESCFAAPDGNTVAFAGNDGFVLLFDVKQKHLKSTVKLNGNVRSICFSGEHEILASGCDGDVYRFDMRTRRCVERFVNQDGGKTTYLAASDRHMAVGAYSGVVNLYPDTLGSSTTTAPRAPIKSLLNLRTTINHARFNYDGNLLAISSRMEKSAFRLVHMPTATVFSNWPTGKTPLGYVSSVDFSPESRFVAIGNDKGKCLLYKLNHYNDEQ